MDNELYKVLVALVLLWTTNCNTFTIVLVAIEVEHLENINRYSKKVIIEYFSEFY